MSLPSFAAVVSVFLKRPSDNEREFITTLSRLNLERHSASFRLWLAAHPVPNEMSREVTLPNGQPGALRHVLNIIKSHGHGPDLWVNIAGLAFGRVVAVWQACDILQLEPVATSDRVMSHITYTLSHNKVTAEIMAAVQEIMSPAAVHHNEEKLRAWRAMVHQYVWDRLHDRYSPQELEAIQPIVAANYDLNNMITTKLNELRPKKEEYDAQKARNRAQAGAMSTEAFREERSRKRYNKKEAKLWQRAREVLAGHRAWTADVDWYINELRKNGGQP